MNTDILLAAEGQADQLQAGFEQARKFILAGEKRFTRFSEDSELSALNRSAGKRFPASPDLFSVVALARRFFHLTSGLFGMNVTSLPFSTLGGGFWWVVFLIGLVTAFTVWALRRTGVLK